MANAREINRERKCLSSAACLLSLMFDISGKWIDL